MRRRGFATLSAVILLAVAAAAITAGTAVLATQWRRSQAQQVDAQLRQYLFAGEVYARAGAEAEVAIPDGGSLRVRRVEALQWSVAAEHAGKRATQVLTYEREGEAMVLRGARLE